MQREGGRVCVKRGRENVCKEGERECLLRGREGEGIRGVNAFEVCKKEEGKGVLKARTSTLGKLLFQDSQTQLLPSLSHHHLLGNNSEFTLVKFFTQTMPATVTELSTVYLSYVSYAQVMWVCHFH